MGGPRRNQPKTPKVKVDNPRIRSIDNVNIAVTDSKDVYIVVDKTSLQMRIKPISGLPNVGSVPVDILNTEQLHDLSPAYLKNKVVIKATSYVHLEKLTEIVEVKNIGIMDHILVPA